MVMSAYTDDRTMDRAQAAGAWLFMPKPVPLSALMEAFESLARRPAAALLVDDEPALTENLADALGAAGYEVVVSRSAAEALGQRRRLETAVVDYRLSDGSGIELDAAPARPRSVNPYLVHLGIHSTSFAASFRITLSEADTMEKPLKPDTVISWVGLALNRPPPTRSE